MVTARPHRPARPRPTGALAAVVAAAMLALAAWTPPAHAATDPLRERQWALDVIGAPTAHGTATGAGVVIAIVDSGVDLRHGDLAPNLVPGIDVVDGDRTPQDEFGHGTHVAGTAAAVGGNGRGVVGTAPGARIMPVRVLDDRGAGTTADVVAGVRWAVDHGADVVNLSLGRAAQQVFGSGLTEAVRYAWERGVVVVVAAGNDFVLSSGFSDEPAIVVSATTREDREPDYSSGVGRAQWGMAAPGGGCVLLQCPREDDVLSTDWDRDQDDVYAYRQGTSMAAPHVAGAAAVLLELGLSPRQVVDRLLETARDIGASGRDSTFGEGRLDLAAAVRGLAAPTEDRPQPPPSDAAAAPSTRPSERDPASDEHDDGHEPAVPPSGPAPAASPDPVAPDTSTPSPTTAPSAPGPSAGAPSDRDGTEPPAAVEPVAAADDPADEDRGARWPALLATVLLALAGTGLVAAARAHD